jgi:hypothetical protein
VQASGPGERDKRLAAGARGHQERVCGSVGALDIVDGPVWWASALASGPIRTLASSIDPSTGGGANRVAAVARLTIGEGWVVATLLVT